MKLPNSEYIIEVKALCASLCGNQILGLAITCNSFYYPVGFRTQNNIKGRWSSSSRWGGTSGKNKFAYPEEGER